MKPFIWIVITIGAAHVASAQEDARDEDRGPYVGLSLGSFSYEEADPFVGQLDDTTSAVRIIGGYRFSDHFALEGSWLKTGDLEDSFTRSTSQGGVFGINVKGDYDVRTIRALGILPLNDNVSLYGGLGYYESELNATVTSQTLTAPGPGSYDVEAGDEGSTIVGGVEFKLKRISIRAEIEELNTKKESDAWDFNVGMLFRFK